MTNNLILKNLKLKYPKNKKPTFGIFSTKKSKTQIKRKFSWNVYMGSKIAKCANDVISL